MDLVRVTWLDNWYADGWTNVAAISESIGTTCTTVGWAVHVDDDKIIVAQTVNDEGQHGNVQGILARCVVSIERIELPS